MPGRHRLLADTMGSVPGDAYRITLGADADGTYSVSDCDIVRVGLGTLTQNRTYTIDAVNADVHPDDFIWNDQTSGIDYPSHSGGVLMRVSRIEDVSSHTLTIRDGPSGIALIVLSTAGSTWCTLCFHGANWHLLESD